MVPSRVFLVGAILVAGCAATAEREPPTGTAPAEMVITETWKVDAVLTEGGYTFVEVRTPGGQVVDRQIVSGYVDVRTIRQVNPGTYGIGVDVRGCAAACPEGVTWGDSRLDRPTVSCTETVRVPGDDKVVVAFSVERLKGSRQCETSVQR